jgi:hypothetical protein
MVLGLFHRLWNVNVQSFIPYSYFGGNSSNWLNFRERGRESQQYSEVLTDILFKELISRNIEIDCGSLLLGYEHGINSETVRVGENTPPMFIILRIRDLIIEHFYKPTGVGEPDLKLWRES